MDDEFELRRFVDAQDPVYPRVLTELRQGRKTSHWMWFVFPQLKGLGQSAMAVRYGIASLDEAQAYLAHHTLGPRLRECVSLVNAVNDRSAEMIFGYPDDMKFRSSMTLFAQVTSAQEVFSEALNKYFDGSPDRLTLDRLKTGRDS